MNALIGLLAENEAWIVNRVINYAKDNDFARYTSTLKEAWRVSIKELTSAIINYLRVDGIIPELHPDACYEEDALALFAIEEAVRHRARGVSLGMFLGLLKYYRQSYLDLIELCGFDGVNKPHAHLMLERIFDRIEIALSVEWANLSPAQTMQELQIKNRQMTNEKNKYLTIFESLPTPAFVFNDDLELINANHAAVQLFSADPAPGLHYYGAGISLIPAQQFAEMLQCSFTEDPELNFQTEIDTPAGKKHFKARLRRMQDISGKFRGLVIILSDITTLYASEQRLKQSNERYQLLFNSGSDAIFLYSLDEQGKPGPFIEANEIACQLLGLTRKALTNVTICDIVAPEQQRQLAVDLQKMMSDHHILHQMSFSTVQGTSVEMEINSRLFELDGVKSVLSIARNITEKLRLETEMQRISRMHLVGEMAAGIGHELRNPMTTVRGFLQFLHESESRAKICQYYKVMIEELDRANSIITEYLNLAKDKSVTLTKVNLNEVINVLTPLIRSDAIFANHSVEVILGNIPRILVDEKEISQLILNLCRNALEAMDLNGRLTLETYREGEFVVLAIGDTGKGIPAGLHAKIGTPFFTTKDQGVGLGLAICYSIAARNSATMDFTSDGQGTTFYVRFAP